MRAEWYDYEQDEQGNCYAVDPKTGEAIEAMTITVPIGSKITTPAQQEAYAKIKEHERNLAMRRKVSSDGGRFYFLPGQIGFNDLSPATAARLIFLGTFSSYDGNKLVISQRKPISRKNLSEILKVSRATADRFWSEVSPKYITEDENGLLLTNSNIFIRGAISKGQSYRKMFLDGIRNLYWSVPASKHKALGYVFQMLPFVNFEWNVLCYNPDETDLDSIDFMSIDEFRMAIGYEKSNMSRLSKTYREIVFPVKGKPEPFCAFVSCGTSKNKDKIVVNPRILYSGTQPEAVRILGGLCKE